MSDFPVSSEVVRCEWCRGHGLFIPYHDHEWGVPQHNDQKLFEMLVLEGAQAGLSWLTILQKRKNYRRAFDGFDPQKVAAYTDEKVQQLLLDKGIVRNGLKIQYAIFNARAFLQVQQTFGSFDHYIWQFVEGKPIVNRPKNGRQIPAHTPLSDIVSKDLSQRGFKFVGSTICYSFMQAVGLVNDHTADCFLSQKTANS